jgi:RNA polymerase sigma factor (sigma-70 family)
MATLDVATMLRRIRRLAGPDAEPTPDHLVLRRYLEAGDEQAFAELIRRHGPMVLGVCRSVLAADHDAEDAFQTTFLVLARRAAAIRRHERLSSWLHGVALRLSRRARADAARRRVRELQAARQPEQATMEDLTWRELRAVLHEELQRLPERYRSPLVLCYLEGLTQDEAAGQLGLPATTLKGRLTHGRDRLRRRLERRGLAPTVSLFGALLAQELVAAPLPEATVAATARAALAFVSGTTSSPAAALAGSALRTMAVGRVCAVVATVALLASLAAGALAFVPAPAEEAAPPAMVEPAAPLPPDVAKQPAALEPPAGKAKAGFDFHGDALPPQAVMRLGTLRFRHGSAAVTLAADPSGKLLASGGTDGVVRLWDASSGRNLARLPGHEYAIMAAFSPDGKWLAVTGAQGVRVWDAAGRRVAWTSDAVGGAGILAFSPDSKVLTTVSEKTGILCWDPATGRQRQRTIEAPPIHGLYAAAFSADGKRVATAAKEQGNSANRQASFVLWEVATGQPIRHVARADAPQYHTSLFGYPQALALSPDGKTLAAPTHWSGTTVRLYETDTGRQVHQLRLNPGYPTALAFKPDGKELAAGDSSGEVHLWDLATGVMRLSYRPSRTEVRAVTFMPGGEELATAADDGVIRLWDPRDGAELKPRVAPLARIRSLAVAPDGRSVFSCGEEPTIRQWDVATGKELRRLEGDTSGNGALAMAPDGKSLVSLGVDYSVCVWDPVTGRERRHWRGGFYSSQKPAVAFSPDSGLLALGWDDSAVSLQDPATGNEIERMKGHRLFVDCLAFTADGRLVASGSYDGTLRVWDVTTGKGKHVIQTASQPVKVVTTPTGQTAGVIGWDNRLRLYDLAAGKELPPPPRNRPGDPGYAVAFSPDGKLVATGDVCDDEYVVLVWELASWRKLAVFHGHTERITALAFLPDGRRLISSSHDTTALVWDVGALGR